MSFSSFEFDTQWGVRQVIVGTANHRPERLCGSHHPLQKFVLEGGWDLSRYEIVVYSNPAGKGHDNSQKWTVFKQDASRTPC